MNKIYIKTNSTNKITYTHYDPFGELYGSGLNKTEAELLQNGYLIDSFDDVIPPVEQSVEYYYDGTTLSHKFVEIPPNPQAEQGKKIIELEAQLTDTQVALAEIYETMLGGTV